MAASSSLLRVSFFFSDTAAATFFILAAMVASSSSSSCSATAAPSLLLPDVSSSPVSRGHGCFVAAASVLVDRRCLIFQLLYCSSIPDSLVSLWSNGDYTFVGVGVENDVEKLVEDHELTVRNMADLRVLAADAYEMSNLKTAGLKELCNVVLGREIEKPRHITMGRWDSEWLSLDQIKYACVDAFVSFEIAKHLNIAAAPSSL
ncbi:3'-5' exonuclease-like [Nicotiana tabacum]|uniref:3'-5' exonuclease-like n=1 Tax=Nicotiana tabacum TaxID=4097 RepID=A0A1S3Z1B0_TOBAC|nr:PREDICTED: exonuclease 3'-5' domain-containing protein 2-like [Nicotiana tabacum]